MALLIAVLGVIVLLALSGSMLTVWMANSRVVTEATGRTRAFILSENGLQEARYELGEDLGGADGTIGNVSASSPSGSYTVTAADLGDGYWRFTSTGLSDGPPVVLEEVVRVGHTSRFPGGAISMVGGAWIKQILFDSDADVLIDGGNSPGIVFSDEELYEEAGSQFAEAVDEGHIQESDVVGAATNTFQPGNANLSIQLLPAEETSISIQDDMYEDLHSTVKDMWMPSATDKSVPGSGSVTWGSAGNEVRYKFPPNQKIKEDVTVNGHGTLVFNRNLLIEKDGHLNWQGNVIVFGDDSNDSFLDVAGKLDVTGNVLVIGGNGRDVRFLVKLHGGCTVNGALTVLTQYENPFTKLQFLIEDDLTVNGLVTQVAPKHETEFKEWSDVNIIGSYQLGRLDGFQLFTEFKMEFEEDVEIHKDDAGIMVGAQALVDLGGNLGTSIFQSFLTRRNVTTVAWRVLPET